MDSKKRNIIIAVVAAVIAVVIAVVTVVFLTMGSNTGSITIGNNGGSSSVKTEPRVEYDPEDYETKICANCERKISGKSYYPSDEFMIYVTQDFEKEELAICEDCAKEIYKDELASGKTLDEYLRK